MYCHIYAFDGKLEQGLSREEYSHTAKANLSNTLEVNGAQTSLILTSRQ